MVFPKIDISTEISIQEGTFGYILTFTETIYIYL